MYILEKDPYPVDALPTCNHALSVCQQERKCIKLFEDFKQHCKVRDNKCRMEDRYGKHRMLGDLKAIYLLFLYPFLTTGMLVMKHGQIYVYRQCLAAFVPTIT